MSNNEQEHEIANFLVEKYSPAAVLLCGSRVGNYYSPTSDWDLIVFTDSIKGPVRTHDLFKGNVLDLEFRTFTNDGGVLRASAGTPILETRTLFDDSQGQLARLVERTAKAAPDPAELEVKMMGRQVYLSKKLQKLSAFTQDDMLFQYYLGQYYHFAVITWFDKRGIWPKKISSALPYIRSCDAEFFGLLERLVKNDTTRTRLTAAISLYTSLFEEPPSLQCV